MKIKTIKKVITNKLNAWLDTLPDSLRIDVKDSLLVSGGCITSMLLREPVNDYDIYIQDTDVLVRLAKHYSGTIRVLNGTYRLQYLQENLKDRSINIPIEEYLKNPIMPGINERDTSELFLRYKSLKKDQIKLDIPSEGLRVEMEEEPEENSFTPLFFSPNAISLSDDIQIVLRFSVF